MSQLFDALKIIRTEREATMQEYARVAARTEDPVPVVQSPPRRRWPSGMLSGLFGFMAGIAVALFATAMPRTLPAEGGSTRAVSVGAEPDVPPPSTTSDADVAEPSAM